MRLYLRILRYLRPYTGLAILSTILTILYSVANVMFLPLTRDIMTEISNKNLTHFNNQMVNAILLYGIRVASHFGQYYVMSRVAELISIDVRMAVLSKFYKMDQTFFGKWKMGELLTRLFSDVGKVKDLIKMGLWEMLPQLITLIGIVTYLFVLNWKLTLFALVAVPIFIALIMNVAGRMKRVTHQAQKKSADITHLMQESLANVKLMQAYTMENEELGMLKRESMKSFMVSMRALALQARVEPVVSFLQFAVISLVIWYGGYAIARGELTGPILASFFAGIFLLIDPVIALSKVYTNFQQAMVSGERVFEILDLPLDIAEEEHAKILSNPSGQLSFKDVSFSYEEGRNVLEKIDLEINAGEIVAFVGMSGAGKTTLINLVPRFFDPKIGAISLDGVDLKDLKLSFLRRHIAMVPQDHVLFRGTILDNIRYGKPEATIEEVEAAARKANAWEFIEKLPAKLRSKVSDRGNSLSGGQKQRISIARAILRDPKILILDEATSALDSKSEHMVQEALNTLMKDRTTLVIAHRLSTIIHAHKIVVMDKGKIIEMGRHQELLDKNGAYAKVFKLQFSGK